MSIIAGRSRSILILSIILAVSAISFPSDAQTGLRGRLLGRVVGDADQPLADVEVTFDSESLLRQRRARTDSNGNFASPPLAPGAYEVAFETAAGDRAVRRVEVVVGRTEELNVRLARGSGVGGDTANPQRISGTSEASEMVSHQLLEQLPRDRDLTSAAALAGGVLNAGPNDGLTVHGAQSWEGVFLGDGLVLNENIRGQPFGDLLIEDALLQTTVLTSGVSAEFGRFTGGVVTAITRSGGNSFQGSVRVSLDNADWQEDAPISVPQEDEIDETFEVTLGGPIVRDRLWLFLAGRDRETDSAEMTRRFQIPFETETDDQRLEAKLTLALADAHQLRGTYLEIDEEQKGISHGGLANFGLTTEDGSLQDRQLPQEALSLDYSGVLTPRFFLEAQYAEREFTFEDSGGMDDSLAGGTPVWDLVDSFIYNESLFCGICRPEERDNETARLQSSLFLSTGRAGSHDLTFGYETFEDVRLADNHQSPNDWMIWNFAGSIFDEASKQVFPIFVPASSFGIATRFEWLPIEVPSRGTDFVTESAFVQDRWRIGDRWTLSLGARYDESDYKGGEGDPTLSSDRVSPRMGLSFQPSLQSAWEFHASLGTYVGVVPNTIGNAGSAGGVPSQYTFAYDGPAINNGNGPFVDPETAVAMIFDWLFSECPRVEEDPFSCSQYLVGSEVPGVGQVVAGDLDATAADELTVGFHRRLGTQGSLRLDWIRREWKDFFVNRIDLTTGQVTDKAGNVSDVGRIENEADRLEREYDALNLLLDYRLRNNRIRLGGHYTWSEMEGNFDGETSGSGPIASNLFSYPEYREDRWNAPVGSLSIHREHDLRLWAIFDLLRSPRHHLSVGVLESFVSGQPYSAVAGINPTPFVTNPGYAGPPTNVQYFFSERGAFETDDITRTDLSINYSFSVGRFEVFVQPEVLNLFDEDGVVDVNRTLLTARTGAGRAAGLQPFDPFTETPVEGVHWLRGDDFGQPVQEADFQTPRTYRVSVGFRF